MAVSKVVEREADIAPPKRPKLEPSKMMSEEHVRRRLFVTAPANLEKDDLRYAATWASLASKLRRHDIVTVLACDESWELECRIEAVRLDGCDISISKNITRTAVKLAETPLGADHHTQWRPGEGWCVIRRSDGFPIIRGHGLEGAAIAQFHREQPRPVV